MNFTKIHINGNDYIYVNTLYGKILHNKNLIPKICNRHKGIGGDGIIYAEPSLNADFKMKMFNSDGSEGKMCGNGIRCLAVYYKDIYRTDKNVFFIETISGINKVEIIKSDFPKFTVSVKTELPKLVTLSEEQTEKLKEVGLYGDKQDFYVVDTGNLHFVWYGEKSAFAVSELLKKSRVFKDGVNVERAVKCRDGIYIDVIERGTGETLSCGSGSIATAYSYMKNRAKSGDNRLRIYTKGGFSDVFFDGEYATLISEAKIVYKGIYYGI